MAILGDSMAKGHTLNEKQTWAYKIANRNGMTYQKLAVNGMFITTGHGDADANCLLEQAKKSITILTLLLFTWGQMTEITMLNWEHGQVKTQIQQICLVL